MATQTYAIEAKLIATGAKKFQEAFSDAEKSLEKFNETGKKISAVGDKMTAVGSTMTKRLTLPLLAVGTAAVGTAAKFESSMSEVKAISGATGDEMQSLEKLAREMGATTKFSASEAADGLKYMALAGWDVEQMSAALPAVLDLAAASGEDLGITSDIVTDALSAFGLEAKDAGGFADLLASASSNSNTNVSMLGESFKYVAPVMGALGVSTEDTALALGLMADNGIKGSQAGTQLRNMMTSLVDPTDAQAEVMQKYGIELVKNADGTINLQGTMDNLRSTLGGLSEDQQAQAASTLFGKNAMAGALAIVNTTEESYENLALATQDYDGAAKEMADTMQDNLQGAWVELKSALSEAAISIGEVLIPIIRDIVEWIKDWVGKFSNLDDSTKEIIVKIGLFVAAIGPAISILGKMTSGVGGAISAVSKFASAATGGAGAAKSLGGVMGALASPTGIATVAIGAAVTAVGFLITDLFTATKETRNLIKATEESAVAYGNTMGSIKTNNIVLDNMADRLLELQNQTSLSASEQEEMKRIVDELNSSIPDMNLSIDEQTGLLNMSEEAMLAYVESAKARAEQDALYERQLDLKKEELELNEQLAEAEKRMEEAGLLNHRARAKAANDINAINEKLEENAASLVANEEAWGKNAETVQASQEKQTEVVGENTELRIEMTDEELLAYEQAQLDKQLADEAAAEAMAAALAEQQAAYDDYYEELATKTEDIYQKMGGLGDGAVEKIELTAADVKKNLEEQIADWNSWQTGLAEIQGRVPEVMVQELKKMGPAALPLLEEYNNMTDKELSEHVKLYEDKHALARQMALDELGPLPDEAKNVLDQTTGYVHEVGADMYSEAKRFGQQGVKGYASTKDDFANAAVDITDAGLNAASNKIGQMGDVGADAGDAYAEGVEDSTGQSSVAGDDLAQSAVDSARSTQIISAWRMAGVNSAESYRLGVEFKLDDVAGAGKAIAVGARDAAGKISTYSTGQNAGQTFANGISSKWNQAYDAGYSLGQAADRGQKDALGIKSPSRVAMENAKNFGDGFVRVLEPYKNRVYDIAEVMANGVIRNRGAVERASKDLYDGIEKISKNASAKSEMVLAKNKEAEQRIWVESNREIYDILVSARDSQGKLAYQGAQQIKRIEEQRDKDSIKARLEAKSILFKIEEDKMQKIDELQKKTADSIVDWNDRRRDYEEESMYGQFQKWSKLQDKYLKKETDLTKKITAQKKKVLEAEKAKNEKLIKSRTETLNKLLSAEKENNTKLEEAETEKLRFKQEIHDQLTEVNQKYVDKVKKINDGLISEEKKLREEYQRTLDSRTKSLYGFAGLFDEIKEKEKVSGRDLIDNLKGQVDAFDDWSTNIAELSGRGLSQGLVKELQDMGPKAGAEIAALNDLTDDELKEYNVLWKSRNKQARTQAEKELIGMRFDTESQIDELKRVARRKLGELEQVWRIEVQNIRFGVNDEFDPLGSDMAGIGRNAIQGMIDGLSSMKDSLQAKANSIANSVRDTIENAFDIKGLAKDGIFDFNEAVRMGLEQPVNVSMGYPSSLSSTGGRQSGSVEYGGGITQNITIQSPEPMSASDNARRIKQASRELALEW